MSADFTDRREGEQVGRSAAPTSESLPGAVDARFTLAAERTVLSWIRTALGLVAAGVAVLHFVESFGEPGVRETLGVALIVCGALTAVLGAWRWRATDKALREGGTLPGGAAIWFLVAIIVVLSTVFAVASLMSG